MGFSRQEYWSGLPYLLPGDLPDPGIETVSLTTPTLTREFLTTSSTWEAQQTKMSAKKKEKRRRRRRNCLLVIADAKEKKKNAGISTQETILLNGMYLVFYLGKHLIPDPLISFLMKLPFSLPSVSAVQTLLLTLCI